LETLFVKNIGYIYDITKNNHPLVKKLHIFLLLLVMIFSLQFDAYANEAFENENENSIVTKTERYIKYVYDKIKFPKNHKIKFEAFQTGFYGYLNMVEAGKISYGATLSICDFTLSSNEKRMWVIDLKSKKVLFNSLVAHGMGTGEEYAVNFSNMNESHQSSLGFYTTAETYEGNNGYSLKLNGVDGAFNNNAYDRAIVIHGADYVSEDFIEGNERLGRSHGCPALPRDLAPKIIDRIKGGDCLFIYSASKQYLQNSYWLKNNINHLPQEADMMDLNLPKKSNPRYVEEIKSSEIVTTSTTSSVKPMSKSESKVIDKNLDNKELIIYKSIADIPKDRKITFVIINENIKTGVSDTVKTK
jgi:hypothetical protein